jgi:phenylacetate-CoA ligase
VQTSFSKLTLKIVLADASSPPPSAELEALRRDVRAVLGTDTELETEWVNEIPPSASGKYRYTIATIDEQPVQV